MKRIKRGRGPSAFGVFANILMAILGVFWTIQAAQMGAPGIFVIFGVVFIVIAVAQGFYNYVNATSKNRFSEYDITDETEEKDAFEEFLRKCDTGEDSEGFDEADEDIDGVADCDTSHQMRYSVHFCSNCGAPVEINAKFCSNCGKKF